jgi:hypothetical protein
VTDGFGLVATTDPAKGASSWRYLTGTYQDDGVGWCTQGGHCALSDLGTFRSAADAPGVAPESPGVLSCPSLALCVGFDEYDANYLIVGDVPR